MWSDVDTKSDFLNYSEVAELALDLVRDQDMLPVSVGVFGTWGTGKSSLLNFIEAGLSEGDPNRFIVVRFDAWLYQGFDDARAALMEVIGARLLAEVEKAENAGLAKKAVGFFRRINLIRGFGMAADIGAAAFGIPTAGALSKGAGALADLVAGEADGEDVEALRDGAQEVAEKGKGLLKPREKRSPPQQIDAFRKEFEEILQELDRTLVVFVDNLDRCLPKQTIQTLEALRLFLFMNRTAFVVAADEDMVRHSVSRFFADLDDRHVTDYLDKLIQVPIRLPKLGVQEVRAYLLMLFASAAKPGVRPELLEKLRRALEESLRRAWEETSLDVAAAVKLLEAAPDGELAKAFDVADRLAPLLTTAAAVGGNPRVVKRLLNVIRMRTRLAERRRMRLDETVIAKLALFERCTGEAATAELYRQIQAAPEGKPELLGRLEDLLDDEAAFLDACPPIWKQAKHAAFVRDWFRLEPRLGGVPLTAAVYLARETTTVSTVGRRLSANAKAALTVLLKLPSLASRAADKAIEATTPEERVQVMEALVTEMRKRLPWSERPEAMLGAIKLADTDSLAAPVLARLLRSSCPDKLPLWLGPLVDRKPWFAKGPG